VDCDFENFSIKGAIMQNLLSHSGLPDFRQVILGENLDMDDTLVWAKEMEQKYGDGIVLIKVEPDEEETDFVSNSLNLDNTKMVHVQRWNFFNTVSHSQESTSNYVNRLVNVAGDCDFENFSIKGAIMQNLLAHSGLPDLRQEILVKDIDIDEALIWAKEMEESCGGSIKIELSNNGECEETDTDIFTKIEENDCQINYYQKDHFIEDDHINGEINTTVEEDEKNNQSTTKNKKNISKISKEILNDPSECITNLNIAKGTEVDEKPPKYKENTKPKLPCPYCTKTFTSSICLKNHFEKHHGEDSSEFLCNSCGWVSKTIDDYSTHLKEHIYQSELKCHKCTKVFPNKKKFNMHMNRTNTCKNVFDKVCPFCGDVFKNIKRHVLDSHNDVEILKCHACNFTNKTKRRVMEHYENVHESVVKPCPSCGKLFRSEASLKRHLKLTCNPSTVLEKIISCDQCGKMFSTNTHLTRHINSIHRNIRNLECPQCDYKTYKTYNLKIHILRVHEGKPLRYKCEHCTKEVMDLKRHIMLYHETSVLSFNNDTDNRANQ